MGKSTAGNKLLKVNPPQNQSIPSTPEEDAAIRFFVTKGSGPTSVTHYCKLLPKTLSGVRVLDTPGFSDSLRIEVSNYEANMNTFRKILLNQRENGIAFSRVLYFLPQRGPIHRADGKLQEEIKVMHKFLGKAIFNIMVVIATANPNRQIDFSDEEIESTEDAFMTAFESITGEKLRKCPPILYLPIDETDILSKVKGAPVLEDTPLHIVTKDERCSKCTIMLTYTCVRNEKMLIAAYDKHTQRKVPVDESKCHPYIILKYSTSAKTIGGIAHILTLGILLGICSYLGKRCWPGFTNKEEVCVKCKQAPRAEGCSTHKDVFQVPDDESKHHPSFTPKYSCMGKIIGGICHILMLGIPLLIYRFIGKKCWPGFTNNEKICLNCRQLPTTEGCSTLKGMEACHLVPELPNERFSTLVLNFSNVQ